MGNRAVVFLFETNAAKLHTRRDRACGCPLSAKLTRKPSTPTSKPRTANRHEPKHNGTNRLV